MADDYERILGEAKASGADKFSMDVARALEIMAKYQLEDANTYILKLVQWAVRSRPRRIDVRVGPAEVVVAHDGEACSADSPGTLLAQREDKASFHLLVGLCAAWRLGPNQVVLQRGEESLTLMGNPDLGGRAALPQAIILRGLKPKLAWPAPDAILSLATAPVLEGPWGTWQAIRDLPMLARPECALVRYRCVYAGVPILLNGRAVNHPVFGFLASHHLHNTDGGMDILTQPSLEEIYYEPQPLEDPEAMPAEVQRGLSRRGRALPALTRQGKPLTGCTAMAFRQSTSGKTVATTQLSWVQDGVVIERIINPPELSRGTNAVATVGSLAVDFSQFKLVKNSDYVERVKEINGLVR